MNAAVKSVLLSIAFAAAVAHAQTKFKTPIQHVIIIVQENRTPDNLFQDPSLTGNGADISRASDAVEEPPGELLGSRPRTRLLDHRVWIPAEWRRILRRQPVCGSEMPRAEVSTRHLR